MSDPQETSADIETEAHSQGEADPRHDEQPGSDVGGQASVGESGVGSSTVAEEDAPDSQSRNPL